MSIRKFRAGAAFMFSLASAMAVTGAVSTANAGECPADKVGVDVMKPGAMEPKDVTDDVLSALNLGDKYKEFAGRQLRLRRLVVQPGGIVPWHAHPDRPANIYVVEGQVTEYRSTCAVPIVHKAGEVASEFGNLSHWWKNTGDKPAVLLSADLFRSGAKDDHM
jgi:quercetin dioxygenase-like cupin family protein